MTSCLHRTKHSLYARHSWAGTGQYETHVKDVHGIKTHVDMDTFVLDQ